MRKLFYLVFGLTLLGSPLVGQNYRLLNPRSSSFAQIEDFNLLTECDPEFDIQYLKYWNSTDTIEPQIIDSTGCSLYNSEILIYGSKRPTDYLIFWIIENEYSSDIIVFLLTKNILSKLGELPIYSNCETCDDIIYPINRIKVLSGRNEIIIKLLDSFKFNLGDDNLKEYQPSELFFKVDKLSRCLLPIDLKRHTETNK